MYIRENLDKKLTEISAIADKRIKRPKHIPPDACIQEANTLYEYALEDKEILMARGLNWELVEDLPIRLEALSEAEAIWKTLWLGRNSIYSEWKSLSTIAYDLRDQLRADFRFAFRAHPSLLSILKNISHKKNHPEMIQNLNDLSVLGRENSQLLEATGFDMSNIEKAEQTSVEMASLLAQTIAASGKLADAKKIRNQAYIYLKDAVDEIRRTGQYVFRKDKERFNRYISNHLRHIKKRQARNSKKKVQI